MKTALLQEASAQLGRTPRDFDLREPGHLQTRNNPYRVSACQENTIRPASRV